MKKLLIALVSALLARPAAAALSSSANGTTTADFLNLGVGARAVAMGEAAVAAVDDATALYWNPAAMTNVKSRAITLMHAPYVASSYFDYAAYVQNLGRYGAMGAGVQYFSPGGFNATDASGADMGTVSPYDLAASLGYAYSFLGSDGPAWLDGFSVGASGKFIQQKIVTSASAFAADFGILSPGYLDKRLRLAAVVLNAGAPVKFDQAAEPLPLTGKIGGVYKLAERWLAALDVAAPRGGSLYAGLGSEYALITGSPWTFAIRAGCNTQTLGSIDGFSGISMGFGLGYLGGDLDYAFVPLGGLGEAHRLSLNYRFGNGSSPKTFVSDEPVGEQSVVGKPAMRTPITEKSVPETPVLLW